MYHYTDSIAFGGFKQRDYLVEEKDIENWVIINVSDTDVGFTDYHIPLNDGVYDGGNTQQEFAEAVNVVRENLQENVNIFVHCAVGQSRSISVLATALAAEENEEFETKKDELMTIRNSFTEPSKSLQTKARKYLRHTR